MTDKKLLGLRKQINARRPKFIQQDHQKRAELAKKWRRPKGMHSKVRHGIWGRPACVNIGFRGPKAVRGMDASGLMPVLVNNVEQLANIDPKIQGAIIGHIGARKKVQVLQACQQKGITALNVKNIDETVKSIADKLIERKEAKKAAPKKQADKPKAEEKKPEEEKTKEEERREAEKIITKRG